MELSARKIMPLMINLITFKLLPKMFNITSSPTSVERRGKNEKRIVGTQKKSRKLTDQWTDINHCHFRFAARSFRTKSFRVHYDGWHIEASERLCTLARRLNVTFDGHFLTGLAFLSYPLVCWQCTCDWHRFALRRLCSPKVADPNDNLMDFFLTFFAGSKSVFFLEFRRRRF